MRRGFSLVELMIALLLGSLLMLGVFNVLLGAKQAYRVQDELSRTQENARFAADFIARDMRMAGFRGCRAELPTTLRVNNAASDWRFNLTRPLNGFQGVSNFPSQLNSPFSSVDHDPDALVILGMDSDSAVAIQLEGAGELTLSQPHDFAQGQVLFAANCDTGALFQVSHDDVGSTRLQHQVVASLSPGNCANRLGGTCAAPDNAGVALGGAVMHAPAGSGLLSVCGCERHPRAVPRRGQGQRGGGSRRVGAGGRGPTYLLWPRQHRGWCTESIPAGRPSGL